MRPVLLENAATGIAFNARIVRQGDTYGRDFGITHDGADPLVEFYDTRFAHTKDPQGVPLGQFVSRYHLSTLFPEGVSHGGLNLDGGIPNWRLDAEAMEDLAVNIRAMGLLPELETDEEPQP